MFTSFIVIACWQETCQSLSLFFFNDTATTEIYTLSLHDALPILNCDSCEEPKNSRTAAAAGLALIRDRKSTRLNSSHLGISYAVFCLKKKTQHGLRTALAPPSHTQIRKERGPKGQLHSDIDDTNW